MSIKKSLAWMAVTQAISFILQFSSSVILARYLTPREMGIFAVAIAITGMISIFQQLGLPSLIVREPVLTDEVSSTAFTVNALVTSLLSIAIVAASFAGAAFLRDEGVRHVLLVLAISPLFGIFAFLPTSNMEREGRFKAMALIQTVGSIITAIATIGFAMLGLSYMSIAYSQLIGSAIYAGLMMWVGRRHISYRIGFTAWRRITDFSFQMLAISGINSASQRLSEIMLGRLLGLSALGFFNRASGINGLLWNNVHLVVGRVVLVDFAEQYRQGISLRARYMQTVAIVTATLWPAFAGLAVLGRPFVVLVYGEKWLPAVTPFVLLAIASMLQVAITMTFELFTANDQLRAQTRIEFIRAILAFAAFFIGCLISLEAAAAARIVDSVVALIIYRPHLNRMTDTRTADFLPIYAQSVGLTILAIGPAAALMASGGSESIPLLAAAILSGVALWFGGLFLLKHPIATEIETTARRQFDRFRQLRSQR